MNERIVRLLLVLLAVWSINANANLCGLDRLNDRYRGESRNVSGASFTPPGYLGSVAEYNAWILACNRKRDSHGAALDREIDPDSPDGFASNLPPRMVKGRIEYLDAVVSQLKYGYRLQRVNGEWVVTVSIRLLFPERPIKNRLDIPAELAVQLGLMTAPDGAIGTRDCDAGQEGTARLPIRTVVNQGRLVTFDGFGCRLERDRRLANGEKLLDHFYLFWKQAIETAWSRPGFRIEVVFPDYPSPLFPPPAAGVATAFDKTNTEWKIRFSNNAEKRTTFQQLPFKWENAAMALAGATIAHEAGHLLGLDDEYRENNRGAKNAWRDCTAHGGADYLMCSQTFAGDGTPANDVGGIGRPEAAKGIYAWIITRRYAIGDAPECTDDADCSFAEYCDRGGVLALAKNVCAPRLGVCEACDRDNECVSGNCTLLRCVAATSLAIGTTCCRNQQCASNNCSSKGQCQCRRNDDCPSGQKCREGFLGIGLNECR